MSSNSYDASQNTLSPIAGTPKSQLNEAIAKAEASLKNQAKHIEAGNVATVAHSVGDFIIYGSSKQFAKVTQAIAVGSSIADGVNVDNTTEGEVLTTLNNDLNYNKLGTITMVSTDLQSSFCAKLASLLANKTGSFFTSGSFEFVGVVVNGNYRGNYGRLSGAAYIIDYATNNSYGRASLPNAAAITVTNLYSTATGSSRSIDVYFKS